MSVVSSLSSPCVSSKLFLLCRAVADIYRAMTNNLEMVYTISCQKTILFLADDMYGCFCVFYFFQLVYVTFRLSIHMRWGKTLSTLRKISWHYLNGTWLASCSMYSLFQNLTKTYTQPARYISCGNNISP